MNGTEYEVKECPVWHMCNGCAFSIFGHPYLCYNDNMALLEHTGECDGLVRDDGKYVYFSEVRHEDH